MPLFTYTVTHAGRTAVHQLSASNPQGWVLPAVNAVFPEVAKAHGEKVIRLRLEPIANLKRAWSAALPEAALTIHVTETRR